MAMPRHATFSLLAVTLVGCFDAAPAAVADTSGTTTDEGSDSSSSSSSTSWGSTSSGSTSSVDAESSGDGASTGAPDGYPPEITDVLDLPWPPDDYDPPLPPHFDTPAVHALDATPEGNAITDSGATLGRVLFYDVALSHNRTVACASCHAQANGFADTVALSEGFDGGLTGRNAMNAADARWVADGRFFWDERAATLEDQVLMPIQNEVEMGMTLDELVQRVAGETYYPVLFERAFGDPEITTDRIAAALAQYVRATASYRTRYDEELAVVGSILDPFPGYSEEENLGKQLFLQNDCARCHLGNLGPPPMPGTPPANQAVFLLIAPANNGLDLSTADDPGLMTTTGDPADDGKFKSPSLRNVALTAPYMHDGRFATLAEVIEHYDSGVQPHPNLDPRLVGPDGTPRRLMLDDADKLALVAFLETLTDEPLLGDARFADPFR
jgi:cytochrome c peroxidase